MVAMVGCAHKKPPPPPPPAPPPPPTGDKLRITAHAGEEPHAKVKLAIVQDVGKKHLELSFDFVDEEKVMAVDPEGTASFTARLVDAVGTAASGAPQQMVDDFALALDELKIQFKRSARGEIAGVMLSGVRPPLEEGTARSIVNAMYSAQRGAITPEPPMDVGQTWTVTTALPPSTGFTGQVSYTYKYERKGGSVAVITGSGKLDGKATGKTMTGKSTAEYRLETGGRLIGSVVETDTDVEAAPSSVKQHVRAEWTYQSPPAEGEQK